MNKSLDSCLYDVFEAALQNPTLGGMKIVNEVQAVRNGVAQMAAEIQQLKAQADEAKTPKAPPKANKIEKAETVKTEEGSEDGVRT